MLVQAVGSRRSFPMKCGSMSVRKKPSTRILLLLTLIVRHSSVFKMAWWTHRDPEAISSKMTWRLKKWHRSCKWVCARINPIDYHSNQFQCTIRAVKLDILLRRVDSLIRIYFIVFQHIQPRHNWISLNNHNLRQLRLIIKSCSTSWSRSAWIHIWSKTYRSWIYALSIIHTKKARWQGHLLLDPAIIGCIPQFSQGG